jgi:hypothetical protein
MDQKQSPLLLPYERTYQFTNSGSSYQADNLYKNRFTILLSRPIAVPPHAKNVMIKCLYSSIWNTSPNLTENQILRFYNPNNPNPFDITFNAGLYGVQDMQDNLTRRLEDLGLADDHLSFSANYATQKVIIVFKYKDTRIDFTTSSSQLLRNLLGFDAKQIAALNNNALVEGDFQAQFNQINSFHVGTSLLNGGGIRINDSENSIVAIIPINNAPGSQILFSPFNPISLPADQMCGNMVNTVKFWITDEKQRDIILNEPFEILLSITFLAKPQD